jgi:hypothetical protein
MQRLTELRAVRNIGHQVNDIGSEQSIKIFLLLEGAIVTAQVAGNVDAAIEAREVAEVLVQRVAGDIS